jgi:glycosyltransferase involved in cell wall biosynthesis
MLPLWEARSLHAFAKKADLVEMTALCGASSATSSSKAEKTGLISLGSKATIRSELPIFVPVIQLSVVIPIFNEEKIIPTLYNRLMAVLDKMPINTEVIFVNDGSRDTSLELLKSLAHSNPKVRYIAFSRNFGHQMAIWAGIENSTAETVVVMDGDLQDPPELIPEMYDKVQEGYRIVYAKRRSRKGESIFKRASAKWFYRILAKLTSIDIPLDTGDFRIIDRKVIEALKKMPERQKFLRGQIAWTGFKQTSVLFDRDERAAGKTEYTFTRMLKFALIGITSFSNAPLRFATVVGMLVSVFAFAMIVYALIGKFVLGSTTEGWTSLMIVISFIGGVQLLAIGVIGEYISNISSDVRRRPDYVVEESNLDALSEDETEA